MISTATARPAFWKWLVCGLLLCASMLLYMDRQTLPNVSVRITDEFKLSQEQYGELEMSFGYAFAFGALVFGVMADKWNVRWLYPCVVLGWSLMGFATGLVKTHSGLLLCRTLLGFFESGHWPCALKTTQRLLSREHRTMGNSVMQSGASIGAVSTPLIMTWMLAGRTEPGVWRTPFLIIGGLGLAWMVLWFVLLKREDFQETGVSTSNVRNATDELPRPATQERGEGRGEGQSQQASPLPSPLLPAGEERESEHKAVAQDSSFFSIVFTRKFAALVVVVACINICWQLIRAWLPKFLEQGRGYSESEMLYFNSAYYIFTDIGCLAAGAATLWLVRRGATVHRSRTTVYGCCSLITGLTVAVALLPHSPLMLVLLLVIGAGALGLFPCYYSFTQELSTKHQGKVTGTLGFVAWITSSPLQKIFGRVVDKTGSFDLGFALTGVMPFFGFLALWLLWGKDKPEPQTANVADLK
ncbi:MAG: MFS transporter [Verrucomicrobia bacterium]|nr:MFS transporter [Verrucomicrobiota bacterium]